MTNMLATWITEEPLVLLLFNMCDTGGPWLCLFYIDIISLIEGEIILIYVHMSQEGNKNHNHLSIKKKTNRKAFPARYKSLWKK